MMPGFAANPTAEFHIPDRIKVPEGHHLLFKAYARGVQVYACPGVQPPAPFAILLKNDRAGEDLVGIHYLEGNAPVWQALDGSKCLGVIDSARELLSPDLESIVWWLIPTRSGGSAGVLSRVTFVQRLFTQGGRIQAEPGMMKAEDNPLLVEFSAQYFFYAAE